MQQAQAKQSASEWSELLGQLQSAQRASDESLQRISEALARSTQGGRGEGAAEAAERSAQLLGGLVQMAMQPVADHLEHSRRQQLGLHRVLMQVATRMQEQIDALRRSGKPTLRADEIDNAFNTMARSEVDSREK